MVEAIAGYHVDARAIVSKWVSRPTRRIYIESRPTRSGRALLRRNLPWLAYGKARSQPRLNVDIVRGNDNFNGQGNATFAYLYVVQAGVLAPESKVQGCRHPSVQVMRWGVSQAGYECTKKENK